MRRGVSDVTTHTPGESESASTPASSDGEETSATLAGSRVVSALRTTGTRVGSWVRHSALYQWLTAEPDPEVIVIDLRETWTVGPFLRVLDWVADRLVDAAAGSRVVTVARRSAAAARAAPLRVLGLVVVLLGLVVAGSSLLGGVAPTRLTVGAGITVLGLIAMRDDRNWTTLRETRPVALLIAALEPPDPPETAADDDADDGSQARHATDATARTAGPADSESPPERSSDAVEQSDPDDN